jgi:uncharacterized membrane protein
MKTPFSEGNVGLERLVFFSDAVMAIAITLLAIDLRLPLAQNPTAGQLPGLLLRLFPQFLASTISFFVIGSFWSVHHRLFLYIKRYDNMLTRINLVFLFLVVMMPFATSVLAGFGGTLIGVAIYAGVVAAIAFVHTLMWRYATQEHRLVDSDLPEGLVRAEYRVSLLAAGIFLASIPVALLSPYLAQFSWILWRLILSVITWRRKARAKG